MKLAERRPLEDAKPAVRTRELLQGYIERHVIYEEGKKAVALRQRLPFREDDWIHVHVDSLMQDLRETSGERWSPNRLRQRLKMIGFERTEPQVRDGEKVIRRSYYRAPRTVHVA